MADAAGVVLAAALAGAVLVLAVCVLGWQRRRALTGRVASFSCSLRFAPVPEAPWVRGIAQYGTGRLMWWRLLSLSFRPTRTWSRSELVVLDRVDLPGTDQQGRSLVQVTCRHREDEFQLMLSAPALAGLVSWLESGPRPVGEVM